MRQSRRLPPPPSPGHVDVTLSDLREAEIEDLRTLRGQHDVAGLEIPMDHAGAMGGIERRRDFDGISDRLSGGKRPRSSRAASVSPSRSSMTRKSLPVVRADVVQRANVRMLQGSNGSRLTFEPMARFRIARGLRRQHFDGDGTIEARVRAL